MKIRGLVAATALLMALMPVTAASANEAHPTAIVDVVVGPAGPGRVAVLCNTIGLNAQQAAVATRTTVSCDVGSTSAAGSYAQVQGTLPYSGGTITVCATGSAFFSNGTSATDGACGSWGPAMPLASTRSASMDPTVIVDVAVLPAGPGRVLFVCTAQGWNYEQGAVAVTTSVVCGGMNFAAPGMFAAGAGTATYSHDITVCASGTAWFSNGTVGSGSGCGWWGPQ